MPPPSPVPSFRIGDRVELTAPLARIAPGTIGIVVNRFAGGLLYDVQFNGQPAPRLVSATILAPAPPQRP